ncbi:MAG: hypothetical protein II631_02580 [Treponema sp.]|nr:hypothetical protein [Treponema sp.]
MALDKQLYKERPPPPQPAEQLKKLLQGFSINQKAGKMPLPAPQDKTPRKYVGYTSRFPQTCSRQNELRMLPEAQNKGHAR